MVLTIHLNPREFLFGNEGFLSRIPSITLRVGLVGMFLNGFLYTHLWGRSKSSSVLEVLKQNFILSLCYSSGKTPYLKHVSFRKLFITSKHTFSLCRTRPLAQHYKSRIIFWCCFQRQEPLHFCFYFQRKLFFPVCAFSLDIYLVDFHYSQHRLLVVKANQNERWW